MSSALKSSDEIHIDEEDKLWMSMCYNKIVNIQIG